MINTVKSKPNGETGNVHYLDDLIVKLKCNDESICEIIIHNSNILSSKQDYFLRLFGALYSHQHIINIQLTNVKMKDTDCMVLMEALTTSSFIEMLNLESNELSSLGIEVIADRCEHLSNLRELRIANQRMAVGAEADRALTNCLSQNAAITKLSYTFADSMVAVEANKFIQRNIDILRQNRQRLKLGKPDVVFQAAPHPYPKREIPLEMKHQAKQQLAAIIDKLTAEIPVDVAKTPADIASTSKPKSANQTAVSPKVNLKPVENNQTTLRTKTPTSATTDVTSTDTVKSANQTAVSPKVNLKPVENNQTTLRTKTPTSATTDVTSTDTVKSANQTAVSPKVNLKPVENNQTTLRTKTPTSATTDVTSTDTVKSANQTAVSPKINLKPEVENNQTTLRSSTTTSISVTADATSSNTLETLNQLSTPSSIAESKSFSNNQTYSTADETNFHFQLVKPTEINDIELLTTNPDIEQTVTTNPTKVENDDQTIVIRNKEIDNVNELDDLISKLKQNDKSINEIIIHNSIILTLRYDNFLRLFGALHSHQHIINIQLTNVKMKDTDCMILMEALTTSSFIEMLNLESNELSSLGIEVIADRCEHLSNLRELRIANQRMAVGAEADRALTNCLSQNAAITKLSYNFVDRIVGLEANKFIQRNTDILRRKRQQLKLGKPDVAFQAAPHPYPKREIPLEMKHQARQQLAAIIDKLTAEIPVTGLAILDSTNIDHPELTSTVEINNKTPIKHMSNSSSNVSLLEHTSTNNIHDLDDLIVKLKCNDESICEIIIHNSNILSSKQDYFLRLFGALYSHQHIINIQLTNVKMKDTDCMILMEALTTSSFIEMLNLESNELSSLGIEVIADRCEHLSNLRELRIANQRMAVGAEADRALTNCLSQNAAITKLSYNFVDRIVGLEANKFIQRNTDILRRKRQQLKLGKPDVVFQAAPHPYPKREISLEMKHQARQQLAAIIDKLTAEIPVTGLAILDSTNIDHPELTSTVEINNKTPIKHMSNSSSNVSLLEHTSTNNIHDLDDLIVKLKCNDKSICEIIIHNSNILSSKQDYFLRLFGALYSHQHIINIQLTNVKMKDTDCMILMEALTTSAFIEMLNLESNELSSLGIEVIADRCEHLSNLRELRIANQRMAVGAEADRALTNCLSQNVAITKLSYTFADSMVAVEANKFIQRNIDILRQNRQQLKLGKPDVVFQAAPHPYPKREIPLEMKHQAREQLAAIIDKLTAEIPVDVAKTPADIASTSKPKSANQTAVSPKVNLKPVENNQTTLRTKTPTSATTDVTSTDTVKSANQTAVSPKINLKSEENNQTTLRTKTPTSATTDVTSTDTVKSANQTAVSPKINLKPVENNQTTLRTKTPTSATTDVTSTDTVKSANQTAVSSKINLKPVENNQTALRTKTPTSATTDVTSTDTVKSANQTAVSPKINLKPVENNQTTLRTKTPTSATTDVTSTDTVKSANQTAVSSKINLKPVENNQTALRTKTPTSATTDVTSTDTVKSTNQTAVLPKVNLKPVENNQTTLRSKTPTSATTEVTSTDTSEPINELATAVNLKPRVRTMTLAAVVASTDKPESVNQTAISATVNLKPVENNQNKLRNSKFSTSATTDVTSTDTVKSTNQTAVSPKINLKPVENNQTNLSKSPTSLTSHIDHVNGAINNINLTLKSHVIREEMRRNLIDSVDLYVSKVNSVDDDGNGKLKQIDETSGNIEQIYNNFKDTVIPIEKSEISQTIKIKDKKILSSVRGSRESLVSRNSQPSEFFEKGGCVIKYDYASNRSVQSSSLRKSLISRESIISKPDSIASTSSK